MKREDFLTFGVMMVIFFVAFAVMLYLPQEDDFTPPPLQNLQEDGWVPGNYSDLWDYNFSFGHGTSFNVTVENYTLYGEPVTQDIVLDVRGKNPSVHVYGGARVEQDEKVSGMWTVQGLEPGQTYEFVFFGEGQCGRFVGGI